MPTTQNTPTFSSPRMPGALMSALLTATVALCTAATTTASAAGLRSSTDANSKLSASVPNKAPKWRFPFPTPQLATNPVVFEDRVYVPTNTTLFALHAHTGAVQWTMKFPEGSAGGYASATAEHVAVSYGAEVAMLDAKTGAALWRVNAPAGAGDSPRPRFSADGEDVYITTGIAPLQKYHTANGALVWTAPVATTGDAQLHATELAGLVYFVSSVAGSSDLVCVHGHTGQLLWKASGVVTIIVSAELNLIFAQGGSAAGGTLTAFHPTTGKVVYVLSYPGLPAIDYYLWKSDLYVDSTADTGAPAGNTTIGKYDGATSALKWTTGDVNFLYFIPCRDGIVNFGGEFITAFSAETGAAKWRFAGMAVNDGAVVGDNVIVGLLQTEVVAFDF